MRYEFQSNLHRTLDSMLAAIAYEFMTGGGANSPEVIDCFAHQDPSALAAECIEGWGLGQADGREDPFSEEPAQSHMDEHGYDASDLADAIADFIANRPDREEEDEE